MGEMSVPTTSASGNSSAKSLQLLVVARRAGRGSIVDVHGPDSRSRANIDYFLFTDVSADQEQPGGGVRYVNLVLR